MGTKHKHADVIKAWADGADIQWRRPTGIWDDVRHRDVMFYETLEYRIKPVSGAKRKRYGRLFVNDADGWCGSMWTDSLDVVPILDQGSRWLCDWVEYEIEDGA